MQIKLFSKSKGDWRHNCFLKTKILTFFAFDQAIVSASVSLTVPQNGAFKGQN